MTAGVALVALRGWHWGGDNGGSDKVPPFSPVPAVGVALVAPVALSLSAVALVAPGGGSRTGTVGVALGR